MVSEAVHSFRGYTLSHFSSRRTLKLRSCKQRSEASAKPKGLWVSVDGSQDWRSWCLNNEYGIENLEYRHRVTLSPDAQMITLMVGSDLVAFTQKYASPGLFIHIDWALVAREVQGILIPRYHWEHRLTGVVSEWYYGWGCASGCIWDADAIANVELVEEECHART